MSRLILFFILTVYSLTPVYAIADWFGPDDYDECIIAGMKGVQSDVAAQLVHRSCLKKFPLKKSKSQISQKIPLESKEHITGRASITSYGYFSGNIYNGNPDWTITELIINLTEKGWLEKRILAKEEMPLPRQNKYRIEINVPPYTNKAFSISVDWPKGEPYEWNIYEAQGHK